MSAEKRGNEMVGAGEEQAAKRARTTEAEHKEAEAREWHIILYYSYTKIEEPEKLRKWHAEFMGQHGLTGRVLLSFEGINGTMTGDKAAVDAYVAAVEGMPEFKGIEWKHSTTVQAENPFPDTHLRIVREIINSGGRFGDVGPTGTYLEPEEFHRKMEETPQDELLVVDVRNHKEVMLGSFEGAVDPKTRVFSEMPDWIDKHAEKIKKAKAALFFCTGGVRCVRTTQYVRAKLGVDNVYQLHGGIHKYLEAFPDGGKFRGKNFVFDRRGAHGPAEGAEVVGKCYNCQKPWDKLDARTVCTVCRDALLVCPECRPKLRHEYHCETHAKLKDCYFTYLDVFTADELRGQREALQAMHKALVGHEHKNRRRTVRKQVDKVDARLKALEAGAAVVSREEAGPRCRTCGSAKCEGACWGFWGKTPESAVAGATPQQQAAAASEPQQA